MPRLLKYEKPKRFRLLSDEDGHDYLIEVGKEAAFEEWVSAMSNNEEYDGESFDDCAIGCNPNCYSFTDPQCDS